MTTATKEKRATERSGRPATNQRGSDSSRPREPQGWMTLLNRAAMMQGKAGGPLYDRVAVCMEIYNDKRYRAVMTAEGKDYYVTLDEVLSDVCINFEEAKEILKRFPDRDQWNGCKVLDMKKQILRERAERKVREKAATDGSPATEGEDGGVTCGGAEGDEKKRRDGATLKEVRLLSQELKERKTETDHLREMLDLAHEQIRVLTTQLEKSQETIGSLNETISLLRGERRKASGNIN